MKNKEALFYTLLIFAGLFLLMFVGRSLLFMGFSSQLIDFADIVWVRMFVVVVATVLLLVALHDYVKIYLEMKSEFSLGLIILVAALLIEILSSSFLGHPGFFLGRMKGAGITYLIPNLFSLFAAAILVWLSRK